METSNITQRQNLSDLLFNPYVRAVIQPMVTGGIIGVSTFPITSMIVGLQERPAGMSPWDYLKKLKPNVGKNQTLFGALKNNLWMNARHITNGVKYSCTTSFTKSMFVCNGPVVQKHLEGLSIRDLQDPNVHGEQYLARTPYNKWALTFGVSSALGLMESGVTSHFAAKATCSMLKKDIFVRGLMNNLIFAPGGITRGCKAGIGQFAYMGTDHVAEMFKYYFPESKYGFFATGLSASFTGLIGGGVGTLFDNIYTHQLNQIKQISPNIYKVPSMKDAGTLIYKSMGLKGFLRGAIPNMFTMPFVFLVAQGIHDRFNQLEKNRTRSFASNQMTFFKQPAQAEQQQKGASSDVKANENSQKPKGP